MPTVFAARYDDSDKIPGRAYEHELGRELLCRGLRDLSGISMTPPQAEEHIVMGLHEKPLWDDDSLHFNISHSSGLVICAFDSRPVGADTEKIRPFSPGMPARVLSPREKESFDSLSLSCPDMRSELFLRYWTLKESALKHSGSGLSEDLRSYEFFIECSDRDPAQCLPGGFFPVRSSRPDLYFYQARITPDHIISLCCESCHAASEFRLIMSGWSPGGTVLSSL